MSEIKQVVDRMDQLSKDIAANTKATNDLLILVTERTVHDQYRDEAIVELKKSNARLHERVDSLEKIEAGNESFKTIKLWFLRAAVGAAGVGAVAGIVFLIRLYASSKGP